MFCPLKRLVLTYLPTLTLCGCLLLFGTFLSSLAHPTSLGDGIRHLTLARLLQEGNSFEGWGDVLYSGYFSMRSSDPWFLTHVLLMPLGALDIAIAEDMLILLLIGAVGITFLLFLRTLRLSPASQSILIALLLLGHVQFTFRLLVGRPLFLMVALTMLALLAVLHKQPLLLLVLMTMATLLSHLFVFPLFVCLLGSLWLLSLSRKRTALLTVLSSLSGLAIGLLLHPQARNFAHYVFTIFLRVPFLTELDTGTEMHSGIGRMAAVLTLLGACSLFAYHLWYTRRVSWKEMHRRGLSLTASIVLVMTLGMLLWVRMLDFLWPLLLILLAQVLSLYPPIAKETAHVLLPRWALLRKYTLGVLLLVLTVNTAKTFYSFSTVNAENALSHFTDPMKNIPEKSRVLNVDWDLFPSLFSARPDLLFARGMDPSYDYLSDPDSIRFFAAVRNPSEETDWNVWLTELIQHIPSDYLALWRAEKRRNMIETLNQNKSLEHVGMSDRIIVYKILPSTEQSAQDSV